VSDDARKDEIVVLTYQQYPLYAASALAANSFARSSFAAAFPLFGVQMYNSKALTMMAQQKAVTDEPTSFRISVGRELARIPCAGHGTVSRAVAAPNRVETRAG
jgi:hypothetical protein